MSQKARKRRAKAGAFLSGISLTREESEPALQAGDSVSMPALSPIKSMSPTIPVRTPKSKGRPSLLSLQSVSPKEEENMRTSTPVLQLQIEEKPTEGMVSEDEVAENRKGRLFSDLDAVDFDENSDASQGNNDKTDKNVRWMRESVSLAPVELPGWKRRKSVIEHMRRDRVCLAKSGHIFAVFSVLQNMSVAEMSSKRSSTVALSDPEIQKRLNESKDQFFAAGSGTDMLSYAHLLVPDDSKRFGATNEEGDEGSELDPPDIRKNKKVINLPCWLISIVPYANPHALKNELNEQFRFLHPWITSDMSLSKLRSIKGMLLETAEACDVELSTVALAQAYFERLVKKNAVAKDTRRLMAAACMILAGKFFDPFHCRGARLKQLLPSVAKIFQTTPRDVLRAEFQVYVDLEFSLHIPKQEIFGNFARILQEVEIPVTDLHDNEDVVSFHLQGANQIAFDHVSP